MNDFMTMEAGPNLDRIVAEKVMGCRVKKRRGAYRYVYDLVVPGSFDRIDYVEPEGAWSACPKYSTEISAAWTVAEKLRMKVGFAGPSVGWKAVVGEPDCLCGLDNGALAKTAPLAICRAALESVKGK